MADFDLIVVGAGPAGLAHAFWRLRERPDLHVCVVEAAPRPGGWVETVERDGYQLELGPQGFRPDDDTDAFLDAAGLTDEVVPCAESAQRRFVVRGGAPRELPSSPAGLLRTRALPLAARLRLLWEPRVRSRTQPGESVAGFVRRRFGRGAVPLAEAMMHGIYAGDAHALEVSAVLPLATELEHEHGSLLRGMGARAHDRRARGAPRRPAVCTFASGMQRPIDVLADRLGDRLRCGTRAHTIVRRGGDYVVGCDGAELRAREVCVTATPHHAARMLLALDRQLADMLGEVQAASVASTYLGFDRDALPTPADGFGFLAPQRALGPVLGAIFVSSVFPHSAPDGKVLFRVMSGGVAHPHEVDRDDDDLVQQASQVLHDQLGARHAPSFRFVARARHAIPQYVRGHSARLDALAAKLPSHPGLHLRGAGYRKVSVTGQWSMEGSRP